jgi:hypothetical protein
VRLRAIRASEATPIIPIRRLSLLAQRPLLLRADAQLNCIDLQPYGTTQTKERDDVLNVGGFSDQVFETVAEFGSGRLAGEHWMSVIESVEI